MQQPFTFDFSSDQLKKFSFIMITLIILIFLIKLIVQVISLEWHWPQPPLNATLEAVGAFTAFTLTALIIVLREFKVADPQQLWMGCALLGIGILEGLCAVVDIEHRFFLLKSLTSFIGGTLFALVWWAEHLIRRYQPHRVCRVHVLFISVVLSCTIIGILAIIFADSFPAVYLATSGFTPLAKFLNFSGSAGFFFASLYFIYSYFIQPSAGRLLFATHCLLFGLAVGILQFAKLWDMIWWSAHLLRFAAHFTLLYYVLFLFRQAVTQLQTHQQRLRIITDLAPVGIFYADAHGNNRYLNEKYNEILCLTPEQVIGKEWLEIVHPQDREQVMSQWHKAMRQHCPFKAEHRLNHSKSNKTPWVLTQAVAEHAPSGEVTGYVGTLTDISEVKQIEEQLILYRYYLEEMVFLRTEELTQINQKLQQEIAERQQTEMALRESEARFTTILNIAAEAVIAVDDTQRIVLFNQGAESIFGYTYAEVAGQSLDILLPAAFIDRHRQFIQDFAKETTDARQMTKNRSVIGRRKDGNEFPLEGSISKISEQNRTLFTAILRDVSERKQAEMILQQERALLTQRVEERTAELQTLNEALAKANRLKDEFLANASKANRLKDEFLANVSHELRTPLNAILTISEGLQEQIFGMLNEKQMKYLKTIHESGTHLLAVITDILDLSKIEAGKIELQLGEINLELLCQSSLRMVRGSAQKKYQEIIYESSVELVQFFADERRLKQILVNLLSNAVKFTPETGKIGLQVTQDVENQILQFTIWDNGIGIAQQDMQRLFQPFSQLDSSLSRYYEGTGLGLAIVKRLVELHGGSITVASHINQGSRFTVSLPLEDLKRTCDHHQIATYSSEPETAELPLQSLKTGELPLILLAEDNQVNVKSLVPYLEHKGYRVYVAPDGITALQRAKELHPHLILMDIQMPGMNGLEVIEHLRADVQCQSIPIIALTGLAMPGDKERCLATGATAYMSKPLKLKSLITIIQQCLNKSNHS